MKRVYIATRSRGFLRHLYDIETSQFQFVPGEHDVYEVNSGLRKVAARIFRASIFDHLGCIQRVRVTGQTCDLYFSYNRFLECDKDYVILLENPTALFHYSLGRNETALGKRAIMRYLNDRRLKAIVCMSNACYETLSRFFDIPKHLDIYQIYPLIPDTKVDPQHVKERSSQQILKCLYVSSEFELKGGREIIACFQKLESALIDDIELTIITRLDSLHNELRDAILALPNVHLVDFNLTYEELSELYGKSNILLHPTRQDSFPMVVLEAMKYGNAVLSTDLYAIPEMVIDGLNGYLVSPKFRFFSRDNLPNPAVWNHRRKTIYANYIDENVVDFLFEKLLYLLSERQALEAMQLMSLKRTSNGGVFSEKCIVSKWSDVFYRLDT